MNVEDYYKEKEEQTPETLEQQRRRFFGNKFVPREEDRVAAISRESSPTDKDDLEEVVANTIADISWKSYLHYATFFDTLDSTEDSGAAVSANRLFLQTGGASTVSYVRLRRIYQNIFSFDEESRFRTAFDVGSSTIDAGDPMTGVRGYVGTGNTGTSGVSIFQNGLSNNSHYGFYILNNEMFGITSDGYNHTTQFLTEVNSYDLFFVEAIHIPGQRVDFYVSDPSNAITDPQVKEPIYKGSLTQTLPTGQRVCMYEMSVVNDSGTAKDMDVGFLEILQKK